MKGRSFRFRATLAMLVGIALTVSCSGKGEQQGKSEEKAPSREAPEQTPVQPSAAAPTATGDEAPEATAPKVLGTEQMKQAAQGFAAFGKAMEEAQKEAQNAPTAVQPVHFRELLKFLPEQASAGLKAEKPFGESQNMAGFSTSEVRREYRSEESKDENESQNEKKIEVKIVDTGFAPMLVQPFFLMAKSMNRETTEEYEKGTEIAGFPATEKFQFENKDGEINVLVGKRFMVTIEGSGFEDAKPIQAVAAQMDLKGLGELAAQKVAEGKPVEAPK